MRSEYSSQHPYVKYFQGNGWVQHDYLLRIYFHFLGFKSSFCFDQLKIILENYVCLYCVSLLTLLIAPILFKES